MNKLMLVLAVVGCLSFAADDANHNNASNGDAKRDEVKKVKDKSARLFELIGNCLAEGAAAVGTGGESLADDKANLPAIDAGGIEAKASSVAGNPAGATLFQSKCMSCHTSGPGPKLDAKKSVDLVSRFDSKDKPMPPKDSPQAKSLSAADRTALRAFLSSK